MLTGIRFFRKFRESKLVQVSLLFLVYIVDMLEICTPLVI